MEYTREYETPLGRIAAFSDGAYLTGLRFTEHPADAPTACSEDASAVFAQTERWLERYFSGSVPDFTPPLRLSGTAFQMSVWEIVLTVPYGQTASYGEIAARLAEQTGRTRAPAQAVGCALKRNPILLLIPCHRIVGGDGSLTGYVGGIRRKAALLALERGEKSADKPPFGA